MAGYYGVPPNFPYPSHSGPSSSSTAPPQLDFAKSASEAIFGPRIPPGTHHVDLDRIFEI